HTGELRGHVRVLREELLDLAGASHDDLVLFGELVHTEDGDDVLKFLVALQDRLDGGGGVVVVLAHVTRVEDSRGGRQGDNSGVQTGRGGRTGEFRSGVQVRERRGGSGVGVVVGRHVDGLERRNGVPTRGGDALLQLSHFVGQVGLVAHGGRHAAK